MIDKDLVKIVLFTFMIGGLCGLIHHTISQDKVECISNGGKWISGFIAGNYSAFCVPK